MAKPKTLNSMFPGLPKSRLLKQATRINIIHGSTATAFKFDPKFTRLDLILPQNRLHKPSIGLRQFWKHNLPTLKFHNYDTEFHVLKVQTDSDQELAKCPTKVVIHTESGNQEVSCEGISHSDILAKVVQLTGATPVDPEVLKGLDLNTVAHQ
ncbi:54S ribosomal protein, mitochondrial [Yamadazyma tenuis]|uniref:Ribosomal protein/NADH dehydrogenase domain-containing protein n=1 Tax=Candida tenuis (strain ATCC 10573 / BCRC 21748 / CBS 615 / JCM 9827 / NBRC 10315 / NRRL Y-1498 / VKM Y-70) TaxID=590646 RepID=G3BB69_CANTC|nr:uncharacterized protein CANTEDRAFT_109798 [Yamadazyma tenuis ATCC 10573]EGV61499.1 hypothetical protein CANTEDRAFT_109798 [Yamadazyma tenuis ATCC 10573]WEJ92719.1 54S ribosomal protein, mitochondrial [Yamadazyma tenuis]